jgi:hypothetical protein
MYLQHFGEVFSGAYIFFPFNGNSDFMILRFDEP